MDLGKRGLFFTLMALTIVSIVVVSFAGVPKLSTHFHKDFDLIEAEFSVLEAYVSDVRDKYSRFILHSQTIGAFDAMNARIAATNSPLINVDAHYDELLTSGTLLGLSAPQMSNKTIANWTDRMSSEAWEFLKIRSEFSMINTDVVQVEPWSVVASATILLNATKGNMTYRINDSINVTVLIHGLEDPIYLMNGENNTIMPTDIVVWNWTTTLELIQSQRYRWNRAAPSFLQRFENDTTNSSCCGIESLIDTRFIVGPPNLYRTSYVDYLFWQLDRSCSRGSFSLFQVTGISDGLSSPGFKMDQQYLGFYGMDNITRATVFCIR